MNASTDKYIGIGKYYARRAFGHICKEQESAIASFNTVRRSKATEKPHEVHATATRNSGHSIPPLPDKQEMHGSTRRAIAELDPLQSVWVQYRYREPGVAKREYRHSFYRAFSDKYIADNMDGRKAFTRRMARQLVDFAMDNHTGEPDPAGYDINRDNWLKTYKPILREIRKGIAEIDAAAMYSLGVKMEKQL